MDAFVQNKCEQEFLKIFKEITGTFNAECIIETEPLAPGGLLRIYKIISKGEGKKAVITTAVISAILTGVLVTPITSSISKISEKVVENIFKDKEDEKQKAPRFAAAYVTTRGVALPRTTAAPVRRPSSSAVSTAW